MAAPVDLHDNRLRALRAWSVFVEDGDGAEPLVRPEILRSWHLSRTSLPPTVVEAPLADESDTAAFWNQSPLQTAVRTVEDELRRTAQDGDLVIAVTDADTRILWTYGGRVMRRKAETVNFVAGGRWDEASVGTNALAVAQREERPSMVFGPEHYAEMVHNWVCWAAPVHDPVSGERLGVLDLSTTWDRSHPIGLATARMMARLIETAMPRSHRHPGLESGLGSGLASGADREPEDDGTVGLVLRLLGSAEARLDGRRLLLNRRQTEILAVLAAHPNGLSLERLHSLVYGEQPVTASTLKAEVSHLRAALDGQLASRPYRLTLPISTDVDEVLDRIAAGDVNGALAHYRGDLMPGTDAPALVELGEYVAVAVREALLAHPEPGAVLRYAELVPYDTEVVETCLHRIGPGHPAAPLLKARVATARR